MPEKLPKVFWEIHSGLPREGPGDNETTRKAYLMLEGLPENPRILDIGCGPGMQTIELSKLSSVRIVALDNHQPFLEDLSRRAEKEGVSDRIRPVKGDMFNLNYENNSFDLIWSEGAIYIIGFEKGLREWKKFLTANEYLVVSELSWLRPDLPEEVRTFMEECYPAIKTIKENLAVAQKSGYRIVGFLFSQKRVGGTTTTR
jgi:ubiquinone/menaquinone biosynthesis C-methylase UbiE